MYAVSSYTAESEKVIKTDKKGEKRRYKEKEYEKNLSTQEKAKKQSSRFSCENEDHRRTKNTRKTQKQGTSQHFRLTEVCFEVYLQTKKKLSIQLRVQACGQRC